MLYAGILSRNVLISQLHSVVRRYRYQVLFPPADGVGLGRGCAQDLRPRELPAGATRDRAVHHVRAGRVCSRPDRRREELVLPAAVGAVARGDSDRLPSLGAHAGSDPGAHAWTSGWQRARRPEAPRCPCDLSLVQCQGWALSGRVCRPGEAASAAHQVPLRDAGATGPLGAAARLLAGPRKSKSVLARACRRRRGPLWWVHRSQSLKALASRFHTMAILVFFLQRI